MTSDARHLVIETVLAPGFRRATFAGKPRGEVSSSWQRVVLRPVDLRGARYIQFSYLDGKKTTTKHFAGPEAEAQLVEVLALGFAGIHLATTSEEIDIRTTKRGKVLVGRRKAEGGSTAPTAHNRVKDVPLPEDRAYRLLEVMGIATAEGRIKPT